MGIFCLKNICESLFISVKVFNNLLVFFSVGVLLGKLKGCSFPFLRVESEENFQYLLIHSDFRGWRKIGTVFFIFHQKGRTY